MGAARTAGPGPEAGHAQTARGSRARAAVACAVACGALLAAACVALLAAACGSGQSGAPASARATPAMRYLAIAQAGNHRLETDFDGLRASGVDLATAAAYLRDAAATERLFDRRILQLPLPQTTQPITYLLVTANQARARLADQAARSTSIAQLRGYERRLTAANAPVEDAVRILRHMLALPPPETS